jgi:hypothetical protein
MTCILMGTDVLLGVIVSQGDRKLALIPYIGES